MSASADNLNAFLALVDTEMKLKPHVYEVKCLVNKNKVSMAPPP